MKKLLLVMVMLAMIITLSAPVFGKAIKIPKELCFSFDDTYALVLSFKKGTKVKTADGTTQFYIVQGAVDYFEGPFPLIGTAYVKYPDEKQLEAHFTMTQETFGTYSFSLWWDLDNYIGRVGTSFRLDDAFGMIYRDLTLEDCENINITLTRQ